MGHLDEAAFERAIAACPACGATAFELSSYLDRQVSVMLAEPNDDGRWAHDGEKFVDGTYRIACTGCGAVAYTSDDCPRCHRAGALPAALGGNAGPSVPRRCPVCTGTELTVGGFAPAIARTGPGVRPAPVPSAALGEPGFHVAVIACDSCDWVAAHDGCPICAGPGPLRPRP